MNGSRLKLTQNWDLFQNLCNSILTAKVYRLQYLPSVSIQKRKSLENWKIKINIFTPHIFEKHSCLKHQFSYSKFVICCKKLTMWVYRWKINNIFQSVSIQFSPHFHFLLVLKLIWKFNNFSSVFFSLCVSSEVTVETRYYNNHCVLVNLLCYWYGK